MYEEICHILNSSIILKGENLGFYLDISLSATLENLKNYSHPYIHISFFLHTVLYCFH